jgi:hypothetical protein
MLESSFAISRIAACRSHWLPRFGLVLVFGLTRAIAWLKEKIDSNA